jgi:hypothetical protein
MAWSRTCYMTVFLAFNTWGEDVMKPGEKCERSGIYRCLCLRCGDREHTFAEGVTFPLCEAGGAKTVWVFLRPTERIAATRNIERRHAD